MIGSMDGGLCVHRKCRRDDVQERDRNQDTRGKTDEICGILPSPSLEMPDNIDTYRGDHCRQGTGSQCCPESIFHTILQSAPHGLIHNINNLVVKPLAPVSVLIEFRRGVKPHNNFIVLN